MDMVHFRRALFSFLMFYSGSCLGTTFFKAYYNHKVAGLELAAFSSLEAIYIYRWVIFYLVSEFARLLLSKRRRHVQMRLQVFVLSWVSLGLCSATWAFESKLGADHKLSVFILIACSLATAATLLVGRKLYRR